MAKLKVGWLCMRMSRKLDTNLYPIDMTNNPQIWGVCLVFRRKKDALKYAGENAKIYPISFSEEEIKTEL